MKPEIKRHEGQWEDMREKVIDFLNDSVTNDRDILILSMSEDTCGFISTVPNELMMEFMLHIIDRLHRMEIIKSEHLSEAIEGLKNDTTYN
jgi:hypothetical protein